MERKRILVGISGASGIPVAAEVLKGLREAGTEIHLMISRGGEMAVRQESAGSLEEIRNLADQVYDNGNIGAAPASGSFQNMGMIIVPCSMKTLAGIHCGYSDSLLLRAADVILKERRKLVLAVRECPFSTIHLRNMYELSYLIALRPRHSLPQHLLRISRIHLLFWFRLCRHSVSPTGRLSACAIYWS